MKLEDRIVPGEMFGTSMLWAMGAFADPGVLIPDTPSDSPETTVRVTPSPNDDTPGLPYVDSSTLTICQIDYLASDTPASAPADQPPADTPAAATTVDQVFSAMTPDGDFGALPDGMTGTTSAMGDILHPGVQTPLIPNAATGVTGAVLPSIVPSLSAPALGGGGGLQQSNLNATLASLASFMNSSAVPSTAAMQAAPAAAAATGDTGGFATPLFSVRKVAAPNSVKTVTITAPQSNASPLSSSGPLTNATPPYQPAQIRSAYGFNLVSNQGSGQTIYIVDAFNDPNISRDLATFDAQWGLPAANLTVHKMSSRIRNNSSWGVEESLDVEWAHAIAPQANIVLVEATTNANSNLYAAVDWATNNGAHIVSMSWGGGDASGESSLDSHFNHTGVSYVASSGDSGGVVEYPSASPYVLSVGGTSLTIDTNGNYVSESAWSSGGGGASVGESEPGYQTSYGISLSGRGTPDVSYNADLNTGYYVYDSFYVGGGGWFQVGGTSAGAPQWAATIALADQSRSTPLSTNNLTSRTEYNAATGTVYASNYHDVTTGSNGHNAGPGYDLATGVGSPKANNLIPWLINNN
jgi:subtilase family serine protease